MIPVMLARWKWGLSIAAALAFLGLALAANHYRHAYHAEKALRKADRAAYVAAQAQAAERAQAALRHQEHIYVVKARETEHEYESNLADARASADRYIAANRVRNQTAARDASAALASAPGRDPGVPASLPADAVMVSERDVQACTDAVTYAIGAHDWAKGL
jgi:hypothetical protein